MADLQTKTISSEKDNGYTLSLALTEKSTDTVNNESDVDYKLILYSTTANFTSYRVGWSVSLDGSVVTSKAKSSASQLSMDKNDSIVIVSGSTKIKHNSDGSKTIAVAFSIDMTAASYTPGAMSVTGKSMILTTIPRVTTPTLSDNNIEFEDTITITLAPEDSSFKHKIRYAFGGLTGQTSGLSCGSGFTAKGNTTVTFKPSQALANKIPNALSGACTISCYTYTSDGTHIGTKTVTLTLNVPSYTVDINDVIITGNLLLNGEYVEGKSTVNVNITANTSYGASIKTYSTVVDGKTYSLQNFTSAVLKSGAKEIRVTVTDTRNKSSSLVVAELNVNEYSAPHLNALYFERLKDDETTVIATVEGTVSSINGQNTKTIEIQLNNVVQIIEATDYIVDEEIIFTDIPTDYTLSGIAYLKDSFDSDDITALCPTTAVTMDFYFDGTGIALGKVSEEGDLLDIAWRVKIKNQLLANHIVEFGTSGIWTYEKYADGTAKCWGTALVEETTFTTTWGNLYYADDYLSAVNYPFEFAERPQEIVTARTESCAVWVYSNSNLAGGGMNTTTATANYDACRPITITTPQNIYYDFYVIGKWK